MIYKPGDIALYDNTPIQIIRTDCKLIPHCPIEAKLLDGSGAILHFGEHEIKPVKETK